MYPILRMGAAMLRARRLPKLGIFETHVSHHRIWPIDIDFWMELNNGRTLTIYDLGRLPLLFRTGLLGGTDKAGLYFTVAGSSVRYRARVTPLSRVELRSRILGFDERFFYVEHAMWQGDSCMNQGLIRSVVARRGQGIVPPTEVLGLLGSEGSGPALPDWVANWSMAEGTRPWPPERI